MALLDNYARLSGALVYTGGESRDNPQVRLNAAWATLAVAPIEARGALEEIASLGLVPQTAEAKITLRHLDNGSFKPD